MTHDLQDVSLSTAKALRSESEAQGLYFNTATLARFMRASYGADAAKEAQRHVVAYEQIKETELAGIWKRVVAQITGVELIDDPRRTVKAPKPLSLKGDVP
jgi:hypothetical protein